MKISTQARISIQTKPITKKSRTHTQIHRQKFWLRTNSMIAHSFSKNHHKINIENNYADIELMGNFQCQFNDLPKKKREDKKNNIIRLKVNSRYTRIHITKSERRILTKKIYFSDEINKLKKKTNKKWDSCTWIKVASKQQQQQQIH